MLWKGGGGGGGGGVGWRRWRRGKGKGGNVARKNVGFRCRLFLFLAHPSHKRLGKVRYLLSGLGLQRGGSSMKFGSNGGGSRVLNL